MLSDDDVIAAVAAELRDVADQLEGDELELTMPVEYTVTAPGTTTDDLPASVEITYFDRDASCERTIEVWT